MIKSSNDPRRLSCPECRMEQPVPGDGAKGLPDNFKMASLVEYFKKKEQEEASASLKSPSKPKTSSRTKIFSKTKSSSKTKASSKSSSKTASKFDPLQEDQEDSQDETDWGFRKRGNF